MKIKTTFPAFPNCRNLFIVMVAREFNTKKARNKMLQKLHKALLFFVGLSLPPHTLISITPHHPFMPAAKSKQRLSLIELIHGDVR